MKNQNFSKYIGKGWNIVDLSMISCNIAYFIANIDPRKFDDRSILKIVGKITITSFALMKTLFYLRTYEEVCNLITLLQVAVIEVTTYMLFLLLWMVYFNMLYSIMLVNWDGEDYPEVN